MVVECVCEVVSVLGFCVYICELIGSDFIGLGEDRRSVCMCVFVIGR